MAKEKGMNFEDDFSEEDKLKSEQNFFKFSDENKELIGYLIRIEKGNFGDNYVFETKDGVVTIGSLSALKNRIHPALVGKKLKITYNGEKKSKTGRNYKDFDVLVKSN